MNTGKTYLYFDNGKIVLHYKMMYIKTEDGKYFWFIPGLQFHFCSKSLEDGQKKCDYMLNHFFDYWVIDNGWRQLFEKIKALGFTSDVGINTALHRIFKRKTKRESFYNVNLKAPDYFGNKNYNVIDRQYTKQAA
ncbi:MAG TPA: hypothetical protein PK289_01565 [Bacteroidia bacterium]|nr:hypothetical protein [Bacteroidia bacterium]